MSEVLLLTVKEAAHRIGLGRTFTYELIRRGELRSLKIGGARRVAVADIEEFVIRLRDEAAGEAG
jgi:excisionase family DNA binding protein